MGYSVRPWKGILGLLLWCVHWMRLSLRIVMLLRMFFDCTPCLDQSGLETCCALIPLSDCVFLHVCALQGDVCILWKPHCPVLHANVLALALWAVHGQPADRKTGSNTGGGDLSDCSQTLFHLSSAMPAHTLMLHFPLTQGRESPQRELSEWTHSVCLAPSIPP